MDHDSTMEQCLNTQLTLATYRQTHLTNLFKQVRLPLSWGASNTLRKVVMQSNDRQLVTLASVLATSDTFNPLSKVLFTFPSRYLFAIGLECVFSFR